MCLTHFKAAKTRILPLFVVIFFFFLILSFLSASSQNNDTNTIPSTPLAHLSYLLNEASALEPDVAHGAAAKSVSLVSKVLTLHRFDFPFASKTSGSAALQTTEAYLELNLAFYM